MIKIMKNNDKNEKKQCSKGEEKRDRRSKDQTILRTLSTPGSVFRSLTNQNLNKLKINIHLPYQFSLILNDNENLEEIYLLLVKIN